ncbi:ADP-ribose pyrophosphatase, mitochondrial-like isoform X2 [Hemiscyllium ocellatum]|uniref:ADP-ribose pyrophosphatase, mitochondrial-like isoform X2 n=1 Tax=Hemiscyllium ocellatum TaxID=170820 RepID=UPI0029675710|nr:ADP-ribose pyrophosphatase, mitochondrial-like isoform X2 [Hemiscyllium ocellatum]
MSICIVCTALLCWIWIRHSVCLTQSSWYKPATYPVCHASHHNMGNQPKIHAKARSSPYPGSQVQRFTVPDSHVSWSLAWPEYEPVDYTAGSVQASPEWADPDFRNPMGRTGITSRGLLGKWGPNHAADPIVTRWKREAGEKVIHEQSGKPILQFVAIKRKDCGEWAIPGGMVDDGELVSVTLKREFGEEALDSLAASTSEKNRLKRLFQSIFSKENSKEVYAGYVDDPRNTDNAWVETVAINFHDETGDSVGQLDLHSGDDAGSVQWADIDQSLQLYATHNHFLKSVTELRDAHW